jgi:hypothetical protein
MSEFDSLPEAIDYANTRINELAVRMDAFLADGAYAHVVKKDGDPGERLHKIVQVTPPRRFQLCHFGYP